MFLKSCDVHEKSNGSWHAVKFNVIACLEIFFGFSTSIYRRVGALHYTAHFKNMEKLNNILPNMYQWVSIYPANELMYFAINICKILILSLRLKLIFVGLVYFALGHFGAFGLEKP